MGRNNLNKKRGFTLIELLVVIAIIGILSSVILASLNDARERARVSSLASQLREIENALILMRDDLDEWPDELDYGFGANPAISESEMLSQTSNGQSGKYLKNNPNISDIGS